MLNSVYDNLNMHLPSILITSFVHIYYNISEGWFGGELTVEQVGYGFLNKWQVDKIGNDST